MNPVQMIWSEVKRIVESNITHLRLIYHVDCTEADYGEDIVIDQVTDNIVILLTDDSSSDSVTDTYSGDDDSSVESNTNMLVG